MFRAAAFPFRRPKGGASVVVYIPNGTVWTQENFVEIFEKTRQVGYRCLAGTPSRAAQRSDSWKFCSWICSSIWSPTRATFGAALALCEICVSGKRAFPKIRPGLHGALSNALWSDRGRGVKLPKMLNMRNPRHANLAECQSGAKSGAPCLGEIPVGKVQS